MTNVSKRSLDGNTDEKIARQFADFLGFLSAEQAQDFFRSFFTESEQIMFVKRLAVIMMLEKNAPLRHIAKLIDVSPSTVGRIKKDREAGKYTEFTKLFSNESRKGRFWKAIQILIEEGAFRYTGPSWGWLDRVDELQRETN